MKTTTFSILAITAVPAATFFAGLTVFSFEAAVALAVSVAIAAFSVDDLFLRPASKRG